MDLSREELQESTRCSTNISKTNACVSMNKNSASHTAVYVAATRAIESEKPAGERICYDPLAKKFIGPFTYLRFKLRFVFRKGNKGGLQRYFLFRCLRKCIDSGITQLVVLGAGLDSRAYRSEVQERGIRTFEVDRPATQTKKIRLVRKIFRKIPPNVVFVPVDFVTETLDKLLAYGYDPSAKTFFLWEGVTYYLNAEAVDSILTWVRSHAAVGSAILFDYKYPSIPPSKPRRRRKRFFFLRANFHDEQRTFIIGKNQVEELLLRKGYRQIVNVPDGELARRYGTGSYRGRKGLKNYAIVCAEVGEPRS
jgi:methyltransferase (TIGR00027 family)